MRYFGGSSSFQNTGECAAAYNAYKDLALKTSVTDRFLLIYHANSRNARYNQEIMEKPLHYRRLNLERLFV